jgi:hypothetical protein
MRMRRDRFDHADCTGDRRRRDIANRSPPCRTGRPLPGNMASTAYAYHGTRPVGVRTPQANCAMPMRRHHEQQAIQGSQLHRRCVPCVYATPAIAHSRPATAMHPYTCRHGQHNPVRRSSVVPCPTSTATRMLRHRCRMPYIAAAHPAILGTRLDVTAPNRAPVRRHPRTHRTSPLRAMAASLPMPKRQPPP